MGSDDGAVAERLYVNLYLLERLAAYAENPTEVEPLPIPGLSEGSVSFLRTPPGAAAAASWLRAFRSTIELLRRFRSRDLHGALVYNNEAEAAKDLNEAWRASVTAIEAAASRINFLASQPGVDDRTQLGA